MYKSEGRTRESVTKSCGGGDNKRTDSDETQFRWLDNSVMPDGANEDRGVVGSKMECGDETAGDCRL